MTQEAENLTFYQCMTNSGDPVIGDTAREWAQTAGKYPTALAQLACHPSTLLVGGPTAIKGAVEFCAGTLLVAGFATGAGSVGGMAYGTYQKAKSCLGR